MSVATRYARVEIGAIPVNIDIDGACLNPKARDATIIVNQSGRSEKRQRFTLAHELGHVLIPTHFGNFIDEDTADATFRYASPQETEANRFAIELLLPGDWSQDLCKRVADPTTLVELMSKRANVSILACAYRIIQLLPPGYMLARFGVDQTLTNVSRSDLTHAPLPPIGSSLGSAKTFFGPKCEQWLMDHGENGILLWLRLPQNDASDAERNDWRVLLERILDEVENRGYDPKYVRQSISGTVGAINNRRKRQPITSEQFRSILVKKISDRAHEEPVFSVIADHPDFEAFCVSRIAELYV